MTTVLRRKRHSHRRATMDIREMIGVCHGVVSMSKWIVAATTIAIRSVVHLLSLLLLQWDTSPIVRSSRSRRMSIVQWLLLVPLATKRLLLLILVMMRIGVVRVVSSMMMSPSSRVLRIAPMHR
jgi:hypothetical protein